MTALDAYLNSYWDYVLFAFALILLFAIIKAVMHNVNVLKKLARRSAWRR